MKKVLVVDDIPEYVDTLEVYLEGLEVLKAFSLEEGKKEAGKGIDLAIIDIRLDEDDPDNREGLELLEHIKKHWPGVPVIVMSAYREFDHAVDALNRGADYFLRKPISPDELKKVLGSIS